MKKVAIIGYGWVGHAYQKIFPEAVIYDPYNEQAKGTKEEVNECDLAIVAVPTDSKEDGLLNMSIVDEVVGWLETPLILIKSALNVGTVDRLVEETDKNIAVSVEMVGEGKYFVPYWKYPHPENPTYHNFLIVGGEDKTAEACAEILWDKMSPDINIHITTAKEAEITKLMENTWGAMKVSFANTIYDICQAHDANYIRVLQAWGSDGRTEKMHMRVLRHKRGWKSKCYDKDIPALLATAREAGLEAHLLEGLIKCNEQDLKKNE